MMEKSEVKVITGSICLILSFFVIFLYIDGNQSSPSLFGNFSYSFSHFLGNSLGSFVILFCSILILAGFFTLMNISLELKLFTTGGYILIAFLFPAFFETFRIGGLTGGYFGRSIAGLFLHGGTFFAGLAYFFWFSLASCILLFPYKNIIVENLLSFLARVNLVDYNREPDSKTESSSGGFAFFLFGSKNVNTGETGESSIRKKKRVETNAEQRTFKKSELGRQSESKSNSSNKSNNGRNERRRRQKRASGSLLDQIFAFFDGPAEKRGKSKKRRSSRTGSPPPWVSKVKYITPENRIEIPILAPEDDKKIRKFKLQSTIQDKADEKDPNSYEEYEEVDTFSQNRNQNKVYEEIDKRKDDYFDKVKEDWPDKWKKNMDGYQDNIRHLPYNPDQKANEAADNLEELEEVDEYEDFHGINGSPEQFVVIDEQTLDREKRLHELPPKNEPLKKSQVINPEKIINARILQEEDGPDPGEEFISVSAIENLELEELQVLMKKKQPEQHGSQRTSNTAGNASANQYESGPAGVISANQCYDEGALGELLKQKLGEEERSQCESGAAGGVSGNQCNDDDILEKFLKQKRSEEERSQCESGAAGGVSGNQCNDDDILQELLKQKPGEEDSNQCESGGVSVNQCNDYSLPDYDILNQRKESQNKDRFLEDERKDAEILEKTLAEFGIKAEVMDIVHGPVVTLFKIVPAPGIKLSKIEGLSNNLALRLAAKSIRIIAPIPGEKVVGIEIPNKIRELITFKEIMNSEEFVESSCNIPIGLGKDIYGHTITIDLMRMPHILIAGATGAGKSVCVNAFLSSMLFAKKPDELRMILIDPKIVELKPYNGIPHLLTPVITDSKQAITALKYLVFEMERRYSLLDQIGVRDIVEYNNTVKKKKLIIEKLPFIVCVVDEFADLMSTSGKDAEMLFARLTAKARAIGIHLVLATQRPSTDVITGLIKANVPARIAFQVISLQDSRIILDQKGAEKLLGQGDMLYLSPTQPFPIRLQGAFLSLKEVDSIADHWKNIADADYIDINEILGEANEEDDLFDGEHSSKDPLFDEAVQIVYHTKKASASYLQRRLNIGYNRAARLVEEMEEMGIVGPPNGSKPREVLMEGYDAPM